MFQNECQTNLDSQFNRIMVQVLGPSVLMLFTGIVMILAAILAMLSKLNVPVNLKRLRMREARAAKQLQMIRENDYQRQVGRIDCF